ncbi:MAG: NAD(+)/NADH kinase [Spirochaetaceae bacterium]|nr:NAD(+)/NADH kinase [Spirochaetaceae bacterium]
MKVLLLVNPQKAASQTLASEIRNELEKRGCQIHLFAYTDSSPPSADFDIAFSLGGDGTVLFAARTVAAMGIPILPLNLGTLGFIAAVHPQEWRTVFADFLERRVVISERIMLNVRVERAGKTVFDMAALNDAVISASGIAKTIRLEAVSRDNHLASYRSDGLIVATPTGSTAYCASAGGPILDPEMEALILNPICPFTLLHRPLVMPANELITVNIEKEQRSGVLLTIDGQVTEALESSDRVLLCKAESKARLLASDKKAFYRALHSKLAWAPGRQPEGYYA